MIKKAILLNLSLLLLFSSCEKKEPFVYEYEKNPVYTWGYADFWGDFYSAYRVQENVLSLSVFTNDLSVDSASGNLKGIGQYLFLEDIFVTPSDTLLPNGTYTVSESTGPFSIAPGKVLEIDGQKFEVGAFVFFVEKNELYTITKFVSSGTMKVLNAGHYTRVNFNFVLNDSTRIEGLFEKPLPYFDSRFIDLNAPAGIRSRLSHLRLSENRLK